jgi:hypothetical protein
MSLRYGTLNQIMNIGANCLGKIAVVTLLLRLQGSPRSKGCYFLHAIWVTNLLVDLVEIILLLNSCSPPSKMWNFAVPGNCDFTMVVERFGFFQGSESFRPCFVQYLTTARLDCCERYHSRSIPHLPHPKTYATLENQVRDMSSHGRRRLVRTFLRF